MADLLTACSSCFLAVNTVPSLSPFECVVSLIWDLLLFSAARQAAALPSSVLMDFFSASKMMQFYLFIFLSGMLRPSVSGVCNGCSTVSQQYHLCQLLLQYLSVCINQNFSWAFLICMECVCTCSNSGIWHPVHMLSTFQDLLTALKREAKLALFPHSLHS